MTSSMQSEAIRLRQNMRIDRETWRKWTIFTARFYLEFAPFEVRPLFLGVSSNTPHEATELAEIFAVLRAKAEDKADVTEVKYSLSELWKEAVKLQREVEHD